MSDALRDGESKACAFSALSGLGRQADKHSVVCIWLCAKAAGVLGGGALAQRFCRAVLDDIDAAAGVVGVELDGQLLVRPSIQPVLHDTIAGVPAELVRMSCGLESAEDLIADIAQALDKV